jgi:hypothetical protein
MDDSDQYLEVNQTESISFVGLSAHLVSVFVLQRNAGWELIGSLSGWVGLGGRKMWAERSLHQSVLYGIIGHFGIVFHLHLSKGT